MKPFFWMMIAASLLAGGACAKESPMVTLPEQYRYCAVDADCTLFDVSCSQCCRAEAVNAYEAELAWALYEETCGNYDGPMCDCAYEPMVQARCVQGQCVAVPVAQ